MSEQPTIKNAYRDKYSGAVIMDDEEAYAQARNRKRIAEEKQDLQTEVSAMRRELSILQSQIKQMIQTSQDNE